MDPFDAIVDIAEGPRLLSVTPDFDFRVPGQFGDRHLSTHCRRSFLPAAIPGSIWTEYVVKAHYSGLYSVVLTIVRTESLGNQLLPTVSVLGLRRISMLLLERGNFDLSLAVFRVNAGRRGIEISLGTVGTRGLERVEANRRVVVQNACMVGGDKTHPSHISRKRIYLFSSFTRFKTVLQQPKIANQEFVRVAPGELRKFQIDPPHPVAFLLQ